MRKFYIFDETRRTAMGGFPVYVRRENDKGEVLYEMELDPRPSQNILCHCTDGFNWGYNGSAPAQCALGVLYDHTGDKDRALWSSQSFKQEVIAWINTENHAKVLPASDVEEWLYENEKYYRRRYTLNIYTRDRKDHKFHITYYDKDIVLFAESFASAKRVAKKVANMDARTMKTGWDAWSEFSEVESDAHPDHILCSTFCQTAEHPKSGQYTIMRLSRYVHKSVHKWI